VWQLLGSGVPFDRLRWSDVVAPEVAGWVVAKPPVLFPKPVAAA
jgi:hypothetical protein